MTPIEIIQTRAKKELGASDWSIRMLAVALPQISTQHPLDLDKLARSTPEHFRHDLLGMSEYSTPDGKLHGWLPRCHMRKADGGAR